MFFLFSGFFDALCITAARCEKIDDKLRLIELAKDTLLKSKTVLENESRVTKRPTSPEPDFCQHTYLNYLKTQGQSGPLLDALTALVPWPWMNAKLADILTNTDGEIRHCPPLPFP